MGIREEYDKYRPAAEALARDDRMCILLGHEDRLVAAFKRIEALEASDSEKRLAIGSLLAENEELQKMVGKLVVENEQLTKRIDEFDELRKAYAASRKKA